jgi:tRNA-splicing ligase RtcB
MPDIHWGYGFPIGGVAALDAEHGVISPGGVRYDINCGVRLARTGLQAEFVEARIERLADTLFAKVPAGLGSEGAIPGLSGQQMKLLMYEGVEWALRNGYAKPEDLEFTEERGRLAGADPESVSDNACCSVYSR